MERINRIITGAIEDIKKKFGKKLRGFDTKEGAILEASIKFLEEGPPGAILNLPPVEKPKTKDK